MRAKLTASPRVRLMLPLALLGLATMLSACATGPARQEPKRLLLSYPGAMPAVPASPAAQRPRLVLRAVSVPDYLDRREFVRRVGEVEVVRDRSAVWAERPSKAITRWVALALGAARSDYSVEAYTTADGRSPDALLVIALEGFEPGSEGTLRLRGRWVFAPNGERASLSGRFDADAPTADASAEASVLALQQALGSAVQSLASQLPAAAVMAMPKGESAR